MNGEAIVPTCGFPWLACAGSCRWSAWSAATHISGFSVLSGRAKRRAAGGGRLTAVGGRRLLVGLQRLTRPVCL